jgi:hypothetical protein
VLCSPWYMIRETRELHSSFFVVCPGLDSVRSQLQDQINKVTNGQAGTMTFEEHLQQLVTLLQQEGRITYRALKRRPASVPEASISFAERRRRPSLIWPKPSVSVPSTACLCSWPTAQPSRARCW